MIKQAIEANVQATVEERNSVLAQLQNIYDAAIGQLDHDRSNAQVDKTASFNLQTIQGLDVHPVKNRRPKNNQPRYCTCYAFSTKLSKSK